MRSATSLVVGLERYRAEQLDHGGLVGGDPAHVQAPLESLSPRPAGLGDQIRRQCGRGKSAQASRSASASSSWRQRQGNLLGWSMSTRGAAHVPLGCRAERRQSDRGFDHLALCLVCSRGLGPSGRSGPAVLHAAPLQPAGDGDLQGRRGRSDVQPPPPPVRPERGRRAVITVPSLLPPATTARARRSEVGRGHSQWWAGSGHPSGVSLRRATARCKVAKPRAGLTRCTSQGGRRLPGAVRGLEVRGRENARLQPDRR
jgi:hypothetical protein